MVLFIMLYNLVLSFEFVDEILKCDHSNESYWAVLSCGAVLSYHAVVAFESTGKILNCVQLVNQTTDPAFILTFQK